MHDNLKPGKSYIVMVAHKFEGEFKEFVWEGDVCFAVFSQPGENRYGPNERKVAVRNLISTELTKNGKVEED